MSTEAQCLILSERLIYESIEDRTAEFSCWMKTISTWKHNALTKVSDFPCIRFIQLSTSQKWNKIDLTELSNQLQRECNRLHYNEWAIFGLLGLEVGDLYKETTQRLTSFSLNAR